MKKTALLLFAATVFALSVSAQENSKLFSYSGDVNFVFATGNEARLNSYYLYDEWVKAKSGLSRLGLETTHGVNISKYAFVGAGVGFQYYLGTMLKEGNNPSKWKTLAMPVFVNMKGMYTFLDKYTPYVTLGLGYSAVLTSADNKEGAAYVEGVEVAWKTRFNGGFYCDFGAGVKIKRFNIGVGLQHQRFSEAVRFDRPVTVIDEGTPLTNLVTDMKFDSFYIKLGVCF